MHSDYKERFLDQTYDSLYTYGTTPEANVRASNIKNLKNKMTFTVRMPGKDIDVETKLRGNFNVFNILAAISVFAALGIDKKVIESSITQVE